MSHRALSYERWLVVSSLISSLASCAPPAVSRPMAAAEPQPNGARAFDEDTGPLPRYHSRRLALSLPLPDGKAWTIDDHSQPELVATHTATRSRVVVAVFATNRLVGRTDCEDLARERSLVPPASDSRPLRSVEDEVAITQGTFDTHIQVVLQPGNTPDGAIAGRVMAFGGFLRKCYVFIYSTEVDGATDEPLLSSRLAYVRQRVFAGLELQPFDAVARDRAAGPSMAPLHR